MNEQKNECTYAHSIELIEKLAATVLFNIDQSKYISQFLVVFLVTHIDIGPKVQ